MIKQTKLMRGYPHYQQQLYMNSIKVSYWKILNYFFFSKSFKKLTVKKSPITVCHDMMYNNVGNIYIHIYIYIYNMYIMYII